jgi:DnaK suppressor protein
VSNRKKRGGESSVLPLTEEQLEACKVILEEKKQRILGMVDAESIQDRDSLRMSDEVDLASAEYEAAFENRLRDREKFLIRKIETALRRMEDGEYDECESCGEYISFKRLKARPETTYCIVCKEEQEKVEKMYQKKRLQRLNYDL